MKFIPISERALAQRINRRLQRELCGLRQARDLQTSIELGDYFVVDHRQNIPVDFHVDLEDLGRKLGVLKHFEKLAA